MFISKLNLGSLLILILMASGSVLMSHAEIQNYDWRVDTIAENLKIPWSIAFAPDGRIFFTERDEGTLRVIENGELKPEPVIKIDVFNEGAAGLAGLALDPNFEENHYLYMYYTYSRNLIEPEWEDVSEYNKVVRYTENDNRLYNETVVIDEIPGHLWHDGGRIKFGPDDKLYITTGENGFRSDWAQNVGTTLGKILRINSDGSIPEDNPFPNSPVFSLGHRNPQGLDWHPESKKLVITEHGPNSKHKGWGQDEVNLVEAGKNYGWPEVHGSMHDPKFVDPLIQTGNDTTWAPSGSTFYQSNTIPELDNKYFIATLAGSHLRVLDLDLEKHEVLSSEALFLGEFGRLRAVSNGPNDSLYLLTSNQDGRGTPVENDDRIIRLTPTNSKGKMIVDSSLPPLKQIGSVEPKDVICKPGLKLLFKSNSGTPACTKPSSATDLIRRGWGTYGN